MRQKPNTKLIAAAVFPLLLIGTLALINHQSNDTPYSKLASDTSYTLSLNIANTPSALEQGTYRDLFGVKPSRETAWDYIQAKDVAGGHVLLRGNSSAPGTLTNVSPISGLTSMTALVSGAPLELYGAYELGDEYQLIKTLAIGTNSHNFTVGYPYLQFVATGTTNDSQITMLAINYSCVAIELTGLSLSVIAGEAPLDVGETLTLTPTLNPLNATNGKVSWTSNNPHIASVTGGVVSALSVGSATITATAVSNPTISADFTVSVNALPVVAKDIPGFEDIEDSAFNFREFFRTWTGDLEIDKKPVPSGVKIGHFVYADEVNSFLNLLVKEGEHNYPFSNEEYRDNFRHTLWMLPGVKAAKALSSLLKKHPVFGSGAFEIVNVAGEGDEEDEREEALKKLRKAITHKPDETRTITLSCGRLTTGVTIDAWTACFMLSGSSSTSASSYLQTIFRVQSPANIGGKMKTECYVFDFAPDRTLKMVAEAGNLSIKAGAISDRKLMGEFLNFCPVIGISGSTMTAYSTEQMLAQLKRAMIDRVARNGFDDTRLYSEKLLKLTDDEIEMFQNLKKILGTSKANRSTHDIVVNDTGLDAELYEFEDEDGDEKPKKKLTDEEMARKKELMELRKKRSAAISILRGIAIRIPLLVYGADIEDEEKGIDVENFTKLIDDASWVEFMPKGVTKPLFEQFTKYFDSDVFIEAGKLIRKKTKASEELPITERIKAITDIFSTFKNPDKETVLTPWRVVNMHLGNCIGGYNFFDEIYERQIDILGNNDPREVIYKSVSEKIFVADTKVLDINSKTGLYPLYIAYSIFNLLKNKHGKTKKSEDLWAEVLKKNIFAVCKTKMAAAITRRTLCGFNNYTTNILIYEDIVSDMKDDAAERVKKTGAASKTVSKISNPKKWNLAGGLGEMKFNAIVGNPPYQEMGGSGGSNDSPIYQYFVTMARELKPSIVSLIIPSRWYSGGRENLLGDFREAMLNDKGLYTIVDYPTASEVFSNVEIKGGICFFGIDTAKNDGKCRFIIIQNGVVTDDSIRDFSGQEYLIRHKTHQDVVKLVNEGGNSATRYLNTIVSSDTPFGIPSNPRTSKKNPMTVHEERQKPSDLFLYHIENLKRKVEFIDRALITKNVDDIDKYKVFIVQSAETGDIRGKILGGIELAPQNSVCSQSYLYVPFNSEIERDNFAKYYKTKFLRFLVSALKTTQSATNKFYAYVPEQDFSEKSDINWTKPINEIDKQLHAKYKLTADQINYIEKMITEMK